MLTGSQTIGRGIRVSRGTGKVAGIGRYVGWDLDEAYPDGI